MHILRSAHPVFRVQHNHASMAMNISHPTVTAKYIESLFFFRNFTAFSCTCKYSKISNTSFVPRRQSDKTILNIIHGLFKKIRN